MMGLKPLPFCPLCCLEDKISDQNPNMSCGRFEVSSRDAQLLAGPVLALCWGFSQQVVNKLVVYLGKRNKEGQLAVLKVT